MSEAMEWGRLRDGFAGTDGEAGRFPRKKKCASS